VKILDVLLKEAKANIPLMPTVAAVKDSPEKGRVAIRILKKVQSMIDPSSDLPLLYRQSTGAKAQGEKILWFVNKGRTGGVTANRGSSGIYGAEAENAFKDQHSFKNHIVYAYPGKGGLEFSTTTDYGQPTTGFHGRQYFMLPKKPFKVLQSPKLTDLTANVVEKFKHFVGEPTQYSLKGGGWTTDPNHPDLGGGRKGAVLMGDKYKELWKEFEKKELSTILSTYKEVGKNAIPQHEVLVDTTGYWMIDPLLFSMPPSFRQPKGRINSYSELYDAIDNMIEYYEWAVSKAGN